MGRGTQVWKSEEREHGAQDTKNTCGSQKTYF